MALLSEKCATTDERWGDGAVWRGVFPTAGVTPANCAKAFAAPILTNGFRSLVQSGLKSDVAPCRLCANKRRNITGVAIAARLEIIGKRMGDTQAAAPCTNAHELRPLCAADGGSHHHLVAVLDDVFDDDPQIREAGGQHSEGALGAGGSRGNAGRRRDVDPFGRQDLVEQCRVFLVEGFVPEYDVAPVVLSGLGVRRRTDQGGQ